MILQELFDNNATPNIIIHDTSVFVTTTVIVDSNNKDVNFVFSANKTYDDVTRKYIWDINFGKVIGNPAELTTVNRPHIDFTRLHDIKMAPKTLSFVKNSIKLFIDKYEPKEFKVTATPDRMNVYKRMLNRFTLSNYEVTVYDELDDDGFQNYIFNRI